MSIMNKELTRNYHRGPIQYLENWGKASIKYCNVSKRTNFEFSDDTKRGIFIARFNVKDYTSAIIDSTADYTETFDELLTLLRRRLFRNNNLDTADASANANLTQSDRQ